MTLKLRQQELSQRNSAATLESVLLDRVANKDWVTGAIPVWACHTHLLRLPWQCDWASLLRAQQWPQTGKMEQRRRICQKPSLSFENVHAFVGCGAFLSYSLRSDTNLALPLKAHSEYVFMARKLVVKLPSQINDWGGG